MPRHVLYRQARSKLFLCCDAIAAQQECRTKTGEVKVRENSIIYGIILPIDFIFLNMIKTTNQYIYIYTIIYVYIYIYNVYIYIYLYIYIYRWEIFHQDGADYPRIIGPEAARSPPTTPGMVPAGGSVRGMGMMG